MKRQIVFAFAALVAAHSAFAADRLDLSGEWRLSGVDRGNRQIACPIQVPGGTYSALYAAGFIPDPYYGCNETNLTWVGDHDWLVRRTFSVSEGFLARRAVVLRLEDCDTFCTVRINGRIVGRTSDRFQRYEFDVKPYLPFADSIPAARGGYADEFVSHQLTVSDPGGLLGTLPGALRAAVTDCIADDPRPSYQNDPEREYGFPFAGYEVRFRVSDGVLTVLSAVKQ